MGLVQKCLWLGALAGIRSFSAPAILASGNTSKWARFASLGEMLVDKLPGIPARTRPLPLFGRVVSGAVSGAILATRVKDRRIYISLGALSAALSAVVVTNVRRRVVQLGVPDATIGAIEDMVVIASAIVLEQSENETFLQGLFDNIPDMIFVKDAQTLRFVVFNRAGEKLLGFSRRELVGRNDFDFFPMKEAEFFTAKDREVLAIGKVHDIPEETVQTRNGSSRLLHTKKVPIYDKKGKPKYLLGISEDITAWKNAEKERDRSREDVIRLQLEREIREKYVSMLSHDLRTPLTAALTGAELLRHYPERKDFQKTLPGKIIQNLTSADSMIKDLLDVSRIQAGQELKLRYEQIQLNTFVSELLQEMTLVYGNRFKQVNYAACSGYWSADGLRRIFENLISNAIKYGAADKPVTVTIGDVQGRVCVSVHNEGSTLSATELKSLFDPYKRSAKVDAGAGKGWGLGLTIVRGLVAAHGGRVAVTSHPETGTVFRIRLPRDSRLVKHQADAA
ncbi:MAG: hypothetical protein A2X94_17180 [Bdellovibrionales bacterium GWB1_55_8]|nr:MAG: hypothetical protein A2X94_17180 [Bdellovibrionales bacterium GWB1_55_8]